MKLHPTIRRRLLDRLMRIPARRPADFVIGDGYLYRWWLFRSRRIGCVYLHCIEADDDDRALHDHPAWNLSIVLKGSYWEHLPGGIAIERTPGTVIARKATALHRLSIANGPVWTLFVFGPKTRTWGFQFPDGWRPWHEVVEPDDPGKMREHSL